MRPGLASRYANSGTQSLSSIEDEDSASGMARPGVGCPWGAVGVGGGGTDPAVAASSSPRRRCTTATYL